MIKPLPEEVTTYALLISFRLKGEHFCDYYESKGWMVGKSPMKDWKAAVRTWKHNQPQSCFEGRKYDSTKFEEASRRTKELMEKEWEKRQKEKNTRNDE